jgi:uncharacterized protein (DUF2141 family)
MSHSMVMSKLILSLAASAVAFVAPAAAEAALGPDAAMCREGAHEPAVLVNISGFKARAGELRVQLYGSNPADFLEKGKKLRRIDLPVTQSGPMRVCVAVPSPGTYAIAVRHDVKGDGSDWDDGAGFSRNPALSLLRLKPKHSQVAFAVGNDVKPVDVILNYRRGMSIGPIGRN